MMSTKVSTSKRRLLWRDFQRLGVRDLMKLDEETCWERAGYVWFVITTALTVVELCTTLLNPVRDVQTPRLV